MEEQKKDKPVQPCVATIGTFDGVHRGHQFVVQQVIGQARERGLDAAVVTFSNHPLQVLSTDIHPQMLTLANEKMELLQKLGLGHVMQIDFTQNLAKMTAFDFMRSILKEQLNVQVLMIGYDNHFGHDNKCFKDYLRYGQALGIEVIQCPELVSAQRVSSTTIRQALLQGDVSSATTLLGYNYFLQGEVVEGFQNGRKLGYPTANMQVDACKLIPENGAYLVTTQYGWGMLNIGTRPTLHNGQQRSIEVHIFDFDGNLYGQTLKVNLRHHLRKEREFDTLEALQQQLVADEAHCRSLFILNAEEPMTSRFPSVDTHLTIQDKDTFITHD